MSRSRRGNGNSGEAALAKLSQGVVAGLTRLVEDNADTVAAMLQAGECNDLELVQRCAGVMRQQQLQAEGFLARFFQQEVLGPHALLLGKSDKGNSSQLAARIGAAWARGPSFSTESTRAAVLARQASATKSSGSGGGGGVGGSGGGKTKKKLKRAAIESSSDEDPDDAVPTQASMPRKKQKAGAGSSSPVRLPRPTPHDRADRADSAQGNTIRPASNATGNGAGGSAGASSPRPTPHDRAQGNTIKLASNATGNGAGDNPGASSPAADAGTGAGAGSTVKIKGECSKCGKPVFSNQRRKKVGGQYLHLDCA
eukprot:gene9009-23748_t